MAKHPPIPELLSDLAQMGSYGRAEYQPPDTFARTFHPVAEHARAFDPNVVLIVGPRGAGKSELFRAAVELKLLSAIKRCLAGVRLPSPKGGVDWIAGYPIGAGFPDARGLDGFLKGRTASGDSEADLWFAYLVRTVRLRLAPSDLDTLEPLMRPLGGEPEAIYEAFSGLANEPVLALDRLDARLIEEDKYLFVGYDELDTLGGKDWRTAGLAIRGLVAFWTRYTRRWQRIRAKVFLRTDLFQRYATEGGADLAKLAANRVELVWGDLNLYAMLLKRIANTSDRLHQYMTQAKIKFTGDRELGRVPTISSVTDVQAAIDRIVGRYMGLGFKKGLTHRWLINHIRDGLGQALPRPLVRIVEVASDIQRQSSRNPDWPRLLEPTSLRRALDRVSVEQVQHSLDEWPWLDGLKKRLEGERVPLQRSKLERLLSVGWDQSWSRRPGGVPPVDNARELIDYLAEVGILRARSDGRLDSPDLFLAGLGLKRKGGVWRK